MIRLLVLDVDGTMTDGGVYYDSTGNELKKFAIKDGAGIVLARAAGMQVMICTGRECEAVRCRAQDLHIDYLFQNVHDKAAFLSKFMAEHSLTKQDVAYCGDDLNDLTAMALCGFVACPADAAGPVLGRAAGQRRWLRPARRCTGCNHLPPKRRRGRCARHSGRDPAAGRPPACRR